jgi:long-chain acyl-CoA synthetase
MDSLQQKGNYKNGFYDSVVFSKVREGFGGRIRILASGSAPLSPETHEFMMAIMACPLIEGYGQT